MSIPEFRFSICVYCDREITPDTRTRTGWRHIQGGVECLTTYAMPKVYPAQEVDDD